VDEETLVTSVPGIYAGGDLIRGSDTAVQAVGDGKRAAFAIDTWIQNLSDKEG
jgi:NADPH-dependent glutamate synthase beta subunit-like oxidoreductase